jgi:hypothetical protein
MRAYELANGHEFGELREEAEFTEFGEAEFGEFEDEFEDEGEFEDEFEDGEFEDEFEDEDEAAEFAGEMEDEFEDEDELEEEFAEEMELFLEELRELAGEYGSPLSAEEEDEFAAEMLEMESEAEFGRLVGAIVKTAAKAARNPAVRRTVGNVVKRAVHAAGKFARGKGRRRAPARPPARHRGQRRATGQNRQQRRAAARARGHRRSTTRSQPHASGGAHAAGRRAQGRHRGSKANARKREAQARAGRRREQARKGTAKAKRMARRAPGFLAGGALQGYAGNVLYKHAGDIIDQLQNWFELETEEMSPTEAEFEGARRFVQLVAATARNAASASPRVDPRVVARAALLAAARRYAPGMYRQFPMYVGRPTDPAPRTRQSTVGRRAGGSARAHTGRQPASGKWVRRGNRIVITGA